MDATTSGAPPDGHLHGELGVLAYDELEDRIQCHACGGWYQKLESRHLRHARADRPLLQGVLRPQRRPAAGDAQDHRAAPGEEPGARGWRNLVADYRFVPGGPMPTAVRRTQFRRRHYAPEEQRQAGPGVDRRGAGRLPAGAAGAARRHLAPGPSGPGPARRVGGCGPRATRSWSGWAAGGGSARCWGSRTASAARAAPPPGPMRAIATARSPPPTPPPRAGLRAAARAWCGWPPTWWPGCARTRSCGPMGPRTGCTRTSRVGPAWPRPSRCQPSGSGTRQGQG